MTRRGIIEALGGFNEEYFIYGEDMELCYRAKTRGWKVGVLDIVKVVHHHSKSSEKNPTLALCHSVIKSTKNVNLIYGPGKAKLAFILQIIGLAFRSILALFRPGRHLGDYLICIKRLLCWAVSKEGKGQYLSGSYGC